MSGDRDCARCAHAVRVRGQEMVCRLTPAFYPCAEERSMSWFQAIVFNACGRAGRFFVSAADAERIRAAADGPTRWASHSNVHGHHNGRSPG